MGMYGERLGRGVTREAARKYETSVTEQGSGRERRAGQRLRQSGKPEIWHRRGAARVPILPPC